MNNNTNNEFKKEFLPIGTVVLLQNGTHRVMITGFYSVVESDKSKVWDYTGCLYPEGFLSSNQTCMFNHDQIEEVFHFGLIDDEEKIFKAKLKEIINFSNNMKKIDEESANIKVKTEEE